VRVVPGSDVADCLGRRYSVEHGKAGEQCSGATLAAGARDLDALDGGRLMKLPHRGADVVEVGR
jgi:hypothetical protein